MSTSDEYRKLAQECRERAEKTWQPDEKRLWLKFAEEWQRLADDVDRPFPRPHP
jgi:hypothetical protein